MECYGCGAVRNTDITDEELTRDGPNDWGWMMGKKPYSEILDEPYYACPNCKEDI